MPNIATAEIHLPLRKDESWWVELAHGVVLERGYQLMDGLGRHVPHSRGAMVYFVVPDDVPIEVKAQVETEVAAEMTRVIIAVRTGAALETIRRFRAAENAAIEIKKAASLYDDVKGKVKEAGELAEAATNLTAVVEKYLPLLLSISSWIAVHVPK